MPRETIARDDRYALQLSWTRDAGLVQAATIALDQPTALKQSLADCGLVLADAATRNEAGTAQVEQFAAVYGGWHVDLNRHDCNRLIRCARTARDQAMGRDE